MDELEFLTMAKQTRVVLNKMDDTPTKAVLLGMLVMLEYVQKELTELVDSMDE
jgi:hypothetical protein